MSDFISKKTIGLSRLPLWGVLRVPTGHLRKTRGTTLAPTAGQV